MFSVRCTLSVCVIFSFMSKHLLTWMVNRLNLQLEASDHCCLVCDTIIFLRISFYIWITTVPIGNIVSVCVCVSILSMSVCLHARQVFFIPLYPHRVHFMQSRPLPNNGTRKRFMILLSLEVWKFVLQFLEFTEMSLSPLARSLDSCFFGRLSIANAVQ